MQRLGSVVDLHLTMMPHLKIHIPSSRYGHYEADKQRKYFRWPSIHLTAGRTVSLVTLRLQITRLYDSALTKMMLKITKPVSFGLLASFMRLELSPCIPFRSKFA